MNKVEFDKYSYIINGSRTLIRAAAVHYFRMPGFNTWIDRLSKIKFAGYNTIDMYFSWAYHSETIGNYDFSGIKDVKKLMEIADSMGLYIIARPGPYINAELSGGGLPGWLLKQKDMVLRNRKDNDFVYSPKYMEYVKEWFEHIIPIINEAANVITVQAENEYYTNEAEPDYIDELVKLIRLLGCKLPVSHNDMYSTGLYADIVDIYAIDNYSVTYFDQPWESFPEVFAILDNLESNTRKYSPNSPMMITELQAGWFDKWGGMGYDQMSNSLGPHHLDIVTNTSIFQGVTAFTHYMGVGGTNWGALASTEVYTSYDFASPIREHGLPGDRYYAALKINNLLSSFNLSKTELSKNQPVIASDNPDISIYSTCRTNLTDGSKWFFARNDSIGKESFTINGQYKVELNQQQTITLPSKLELNELCIEFSTIPILCRIQEKSKQVIVMDTEFSGTINILTQLKFKLNYSEHHQNIDLISDHEGIEITYSKKNPLIKPISIQIQSEDYLTTIIFPPENIIKHIFKLEKNILIGPEYLLKKNNLDLLAINNLQQIFCIDINGSITSKHLDCPNKVGIINFNELEFTNIGIEIDQPNIDNTWKKVGNYLDSDSNDIYEGYFWYKTSYIEKIKSLSIDARHCVSVYLNGHEVIAQDNFNYISGKDEDQPFIVNIPENIQKETNCITLLIQSLGHCKGFEDDAANPRGLLSCASIPETNFNWHIKPAITTNSISDSNLQILNNEVKNKFLTCISGTFNFICKENYQIPLYLVFKDPPFNKVSIFLNDIHIGHFWRDKGPQTKFYLPEEFYFSDGQTNTFKLIVWNRNNDNKLSSQNSSLNDNIYLEPCGVNKLYQIKEILDICL